MANYIKIGTSSSAPTYSYPGSEILSINPYMAVDMAGQELSADGLLAVVIDSASSNVINTKYGTPVWWQNGSQTLKFYCKKVSCVGKTRFQIEAVSAIGLLDKMYHNGGLYEREKFGVVIADIMSSSDWIRRLPTAYQEVEYLKDNANSPYINSLLYPAIKNGVYPEIECEIMYDQLPARGSLIYPFGCGKFTGAYSDNLCIGIGYLGGVSAFFDMDIQSASGVTTVANTWYKVGFTNTLKDGAVVPAIIVDSSVYPISLVVSTQPTTNGVTLMNYPMGVFAALGYGGSVSRAPAACGLKIRSCKMSVGGKLERNFVPCYRKSDNATGMYDLVYSKFYKTAGGAFTLGPDVGVMSGPAIIPITIGSSGLYDVLVSGWLPRDTKRNNLFRLLSAYSTNVTKDSNGNLYVSWLTQSGQSIQRIPDERIYYEGDVEYPEIPSEVRVTEHSFTKSQNAPAEILNIEDATTEAVIYFNNAPIDPSTIYADDTIEIHLANENLIKLSGQGKVYGTPYIHSKRTLVRENSTATTDKIITVSENTLISSINSANVADRLMDFYKNGRRIKNSIVYNEETPGRLYILNDPHGESAQAWLLKVDAIISAKIKASAEFIKGITPVGKAGIYTTSLAKTGSGSITIPSSFKAVRVILIGGGQGGEDGGNGEAGVGGSWAVQYTDHTQTGPSGNTGQGGKGGKGGRAGAPGKVLIVDFGAEVAGKTISYSCGAGGTRGLNPGGNTTITIAALSLSFSTANGKSGPFKDPFNPLNIYAAEGENGVDGGDGGSAKRTAPIGTGNFNSSPGGDASYNNEYLGGAVGTSVNMVVPSQNIDINCQGGSGGGAAVGNPGGAGFAAIDSGGTAYPGNGGNGKNAISRTEAMNPGQGGHGGHGGGGGGGGGHSFSVWGNKVCTSTSNGGPGGAGGYASNGGSGAVIFLLEDGL